jgi:peptidyl-prolyl cis-trans isomerase C
MRMIAVAVLSVSAVFGQASGDVLASVDEETLTWDDLVNIVGGEDNTQYLGINSEASAQEVLDSWVREELIVTAARDAGLESDPMVSFSIDQAVRQILLEAYLMDIMSDVEVSRLDVENYVNAWGDSYTREINTRHILVSDRNLANSILARIQGGADFAEMAEQYSICPSSVDGGNLGWLYRGEAVLPFLEAAYQLSPGELSGVVQTSMGYHIIQLLDTRDVSPAPAQADIIQLATQELTAAAQEGAVMDVLDGLMTAHIVNTYPQRLLDHL